jgi:hypothetical protein
MRVLAPLPGGPHARRPGPELRPEPEPLKPKPLEPKQLEPKPLLRPE